MTDPHSELEYKWGADQVAGGDFVSWCQARRPERFTSGAGPDIYYGLSGNVVRHRWNGGGAGTLTVKKRKSKYSTTDRVEIDLSFADHIAVMDVTRFLNVSGWKRLFTLLPDDCLVFLFAPRPGVKVSVALYGVSCLNARTQRLTNRRRFLEVEVEKGSACTPTEAKALLDEWRTALEGAFAIDAPLNSSLFEIYSKSQPKADRKRPR